MSIEAFQRSSGVGTEDANLARVGVPPRLPEHALGRKSACGQLEVQACGDAARGTLFPVNGGGMASHCCSC